MSASGFAAVAGSWAVVSTLAADLGHTALFPALCGGGTLHLLTPEQALDPEAFADYAERHRIDALKIVPSHLAALLAGTRPASVLPRELLVLGGEATSWELAGRIAELAPDLRVLHHYGPTETTVGAVAGPIEPSAWSPWSPRPALGRPLAPLRADADDVAFREERVSALADARNLDALLLARIQFGFTIAFTALYVGWQAAPTPEGVSRATTSARESSASRAPPWLPGTQARRQPSGRAARNASTAWRRWPASSAASTRSYSSGDRPCSATSSPTRPSASTTRN